MTVSVAGTDGERTVGAGASCEGAACRILGARVAAGG